VDLEECALECWKHGSLFDLRTGEALTLPALKPVAVHTVTVEGDEVLVELSEGGSR
jgi:3-phenylpropionate/trans-cinnamate dioxygenase ferredoxin subunit